MSTRKKSAKRPVLIETKVDKIFATKGEVEGFKASLAKFGVTETHVTEVKGGFQIVYRTRKSA